ncbi:SDR family oxidoreductase, partial [bacterium]|nr:SDR family oxidoreductase [bacterium]
MMVNLATIQNHIQAQAVKESGRYGIAVDEAAFPQNSPENLRKSLLKALESDKIDYMLAHLAHPAFIEKMVNKAVEAYGQLNIAIANAGITLFGAFSSYPVADFNRVMDVNLKGTFYLAQFASNQMIKQSSGGSLLFTSSVTGHQAHKNLAAYSMTKAGIEMLAKNLVSEIAEHGINV